jgi:hypothetical protein
VKSSGAAAICISTRGTTACNGGRLNNVVSEQPISMT